LLSVFADMAVPDGAPYFVPFVYPFIDRELLDRFPHPDARWSRYGDEARRYLTLAPNVAAGDVAACSVPWRFVLDNPTVEADVRRLAAEAAAAGKSILVFCDDDRDLLVDLPNAIVFKCSLYASRRALREFAQPAFGRDVLAERGADLAPRPKTGAPSVGFCGLAPPLGAAGIAHRVRRSAARRLRAWGLKDASSYPARAGAIDVLRADRRIVTDFLIRGDTMWELHERTPAEWRGEFLDNLLGNDYALCARGNGNYSFRLYEALSAGRIPVFIDTDCVLPCEDVDWREVFPHVDGSELRHLPDRILEFHEGMTSAEFEERQRLCRSLWERYLSPDGFHRWIATELLPRLLTS
jgi:hypothetical protein